MKAAAIAAVFLVIFAIALWPTANDTFTEKLLTVLPGDWHAHNGYSVDFSGDLRQVAWMQGEVPECVVVHGDRRYAGDHYCAISLSHDGEHLAFFDHSKMTETAVLIDGQAGPAYRTILWPMIRSPRGHAFATVAAHQRSESEFLLLNGRKASEEFETVWQIVFSPDGKSVAFAGQRGDDVFVVVDGRLTGPFGEARSLHFSPEGNAAFADGSAVYVGGQKTVVDHFVRFLVTGPGGCRLTATHVDDSSDVFFGSERWRVNGRLHSAAISPDGRSAAFWTKQGDKSELHLGRTSIATGKHVFGTPVFSPAGSVMAVKSQEMADCFLWIGFTKHGPYDYVTDPVFSPDGSKVAFGVVKDRKVWRKVLRVKP